MTPEDFSFKKQCQATHHRVCSLLAQNKVEEAFEMVNNIEVTAKQWEEYERSVQLRSRLMRHMLADLSKRKRIKTAELKRRQK